jgi:hypothetical protein
MNFENMNAENRSSVSIENNLVRGGRLNNLRNIIRCCSFCREQGHSINNCNDQRIINFGNECLIQKHLFDYTDDSRNNFKNWLMTYYLEMDRELVKAYAISKCDCRLRSSVDFIIDKIVEHIYPEQNGNEEDVIPLIDEIIQDDNLLTLRILQFLRYYTRINNESLNDSEQKLDITVQIEENDKMEIDKNCDCAICYEDNLSEKNFVKLNCQHNFCKDCLQTCLKNVYINQQIPSCALCRAEITTIVVHDEKIQDEFNEIINNK